MTSKIMIIIALAFMFGCDLNRTGYALVECYNEGQVVYKANNEQCPSFAGTGYAKLANGVIIKGECRCSTSWEEK